MSGAATARVAAGIPRLLPRENVRSFLLGSKAGWTVMTPEWVEDLIPLITRRTSKADVVVLRAIYRYTRGAQGDGRNPFNRPIWCELTDEQFARRCGCDLDAISESVRVLKAAGWIIAENEGRRGRRLRLDFERLREKYDADYDALVNREQLTRIERKPPSPAAAARSCANPDPSSDKSDVFAENKEVIVRNTGFKTGHSVEPLLLLPTKDAKPIPLSFACPACGETAEIRLRQETPIALEVTAGVGKDGRLEIALREPEPAAAPPSGATKQAPAASANDSPAPARAPAYGMAELAAFLQEMFRDEGFPGGPLIRRLAKLPTTHQIREIYRRMNGAPLEMFRKGAEENSRKIHAIGFLYCVADDVGDKDAQEAWRATHARRNPLDVLREARSLGREKKERTSHE